eukprot:TRINITY_DN28209_c0_g1_i1.p1 TRINITY_DN28209_c0_g1~~TRINITY_DN28209_c0_g1_i1.p1  ORF type:complete len:105 (+),score=16.08 TRINITY_DN28209_c0_g1_i1:65-379(+)
MFKNVLPIIALTLLASQQAVANEPYLVDGTTLAVVAGCAFRCFPSNTTGDRTPNPQVEEELMHTMAAWLANVANLTRSGILEITALESQICTTRSFPKELGSNT